MTWNEGGTPRDHEGNPVTPDHQQNQQAPWAASNEPEQHQPAPSWQDANAGQTPPAHSGTPAQPQYPSFSEDRPGAAVPPHLSEQNSRDEEPPVPAGKHAANDYQAASSEPATGSATWSTAGTWPDANEQTAPEHAPEHTPGQTPEQATEQAPEPAAESSLKKTAEPTADTHQPNDAQDAETTAAEQPTMAYPNDAFSGATAFHAGSDAQAPTQAYPSGAFDSVEPHPDQQATEAFNNVPGWPAPLPEARQDAEGQDPQPGYGEPQGFDGAGSFGPAYAGPEAQYAAGAPAAIDASTPYDAPGQAPQNQGIFPPSQPGAFPPSQQENDPNASQKKPWYKRAAIIVPLVIVLILGVAAAIGIPWFLHQQNVNKGNDLAATFQEERRAYEQVWTAESIESVNAVNLGDVVRGTSETFYDFPKSAVASMRKSCEVLPDARARYNELADASVPELPQEDGADASEEYQQAQKDAEKLASERKEAEEFLAASDKSLKAQEQFCETYNGYADIMSDYRNDLENTMPSALTLKEGEEVVVESAKLVFTCNASGGCPNLYKKETREQYAKAYEDTFVDYFDKLSKQYQDHCFAEDFKKVCETAAKEYKAAADANRELVEHLRNTEPTLEEGKSLYPKIPEISDKIAQAEDQADERVIKSWSEVEPSVTGAMSSTGNSLGNYFDSLRETAIKAGEGLA
nr:hypothetical protein [Pseudoclavibacter sp. Marseille-Q3772]